jgi:hypothetical protein
VHFWTTTKRRASSVESMTPTDAQIPVPEAARRLRLPGDEVYRLIFRGELLAGPHKDGAVYVSAGSLEAYLSKRPTAPTEHS